MVILNRPDPLAKARALTPPDGPIWPHPVEFTAVESLTTRGGPSLLLQPNTPQTPGQGAPRSLRQYFMVNLGGGNVIFTRP